MPLLFSSIQIWFLIVWLCNTNGFHDWFTPLYWLNKLKAFLHNAIQHVYVWFCNSPHRLINQLCIVYKKCHFINWKNAVYVKKKNVFRYFQRTFMKNGCYKKGPEHCIHFDANNNISFSKNIRVSINVHHTSVHTGHHISVLRNYLKEK